MGKGTIVSSKVSRRTLIASAGVGTIASGGAVAAASFKPPGRVTPRSESCFVTSQQIDGPYYFDHQLVRRDITERQPGIPLTVLIHVLDDQCRPVVGARADIWQADQVGVYSGYKDQGDELNVDKTGQTYLRGTQFTDPNGDVEFATIYPGWYRGRTTHIHLKLFLDQATVCTAQMYFPDALSEFIYQQAPGYVRPLVRDKLNRNDRRFAQAEGHGYLSIREREGGYAADFTVGVNRAARPPKGLERYPPGPPSRGPVLGHAERIKLLVPGY